MGDQMVHVPTRTADASPEFVTAALRSTGVIDADTTVAEVEHDRIGEGVGLMCELARLTLRYRGPAHHAPSSVIIKLPSNLPENRQLGDLLGFYAREGHFYDQIGRTVPVRTPHCYFNHIDTEANAFALLLEDFGDRTMVSQIAGIDVDRATDAVRALARVHARYWESPDLAALTWLPRAIDPPIMAAGTAYRDAWPRFVELFADRLPDGALELGERVGASWETAEAAFYERSPVTLVHGDFRADNLMFDDDADDDERVGLLDWQIAFQVGGISDICYLLTQSMTLDDRRLHEREVVDVWFDAVSTALGRAPDGYTADDAWTDYRAMTGNMTVYGVVAGGSLDPSNERGMHLVADMASRAFLAALDLDAATLIPA